VTWISLSRSKGQGQQAALVGCTGRPTWTYTGDLSICVHDVYLVTTCRPVRRHIVAATRLQLVNYYCYYTHNKHSIRQPKDKLRAGRGGISNRNTNDAICSIPVKMPLERKHQQRLIKPFRLMLSAKADDELRCAAVLLDTKMALIVLPPKMAHEEMLLMCWMPVQVPPCWLAVAPECQNTHTHTHMQAVLPHHYAPTPYDGGIKR